MIEIKLSNLDSVLRDLKNKQQVVEQATKDKDFLEQTGFILSASAQRNIDEGQAEGKAYAVLKASTLNQKQRKGYGSEPLRRSGLLQQSINHEVGTELQLSAVHYAKYHQTGTKRMEQRKIFAPDAMDIEDIEDALRNSIITKMKHT